MRRGRDATTAGVTHASGERRRRVGAASHSSFAGRAAEATAWGPHLREAHRVHACQGFCWPLVQETACARTGTRVGMGLPFDTDRVASAAMPLPPLLAGAGMGCACQGDVQAAADATAAAAAAAAVLLDPWPL